MEAVVLVIHLIVALAIITVVLLQPSETGGFMGNSGSMSNMMAPRRKGDLLTRLTTILACVFFVTSLSLALIAKRNSVANSGSILDVAPVASTSAPVADDVPAAKPEAPISQ